MRSIRNFSTGNWFDRRILDHWEMRSIRNLYVLERQLDLYFRSLGNAPYPERKHASCYSYLDFRSLGNALYPEHVLAPAAVECHFRSLGNALQQKQQQIYTKIYLLPIICFCSFPQ